MELNIKTMYFLVWLSVCITVSIGIIVTEKLTPMWFLLIPALISFNTKES